jgi:lipid-binding SYLF domain-containing protein
MIRFALAALLALTPLAARAQTEQQALVDRATLTVQEMLTTGNSSDILNLMKRARGALICPRVFRAGFFFGGEGGGCVLVGRSGAEGAAPAAAPAGTVPVTATPLAAPAAAAPAAPRAGSVPAASAAAAAAPAAAAPAGAAWSSPAFYGMGSGSFGLQIGIEDSEVIFVVLTDKGLRALLDSQFKIGADLGIAVATIGAGIQGSTTAALRADIVAFSQARGLYAGVSLQGSIIAARSEWNQTYYGKPLSSQQIVLNMEGQNPGADPLKEMLARFSNG